MFVEDCSLVCCLCHTTDCFHYYIDEEDLSCPAFLFELVDDYPDTTFVNNVVSASHALDDQIEEKPVDLTAYFVYQLFQQAFVQQLIYWTFVFDCRAFLRFLNALLLYTIHGQSAAQKQQLDHLKLVQLLMKQGFNARAFIK